MRRSLFARTVITSMLVATFVVGSGLPLAAQNAKATKKACGRLGPLSVSILDGKLSKAEQKRLAAVGTAIGENGKAGAKKVAKQVAAAGKKRSKQERAVASAGSWCDSAGYTTGITTTTTLSQLQRAQAAYFLISGAANAVADQAVQLGPEEGCALLAPASEKFANELKAYDDWPLDAEEEIDNLANSLAATAGVLYACSRVQATQSQIDSALDASRAAASAVRLALQLPIDR